MKALDETHIDNNWRSFLTYRDRRLQGINTGLPSLDAYLLGLGGIVMFQGETSSGKSTLALQIAHHNVRHANHSLLIVDKENGEGRLRSRLLCQANDITETDIVTCDIPKLKEYRQALQGLPVHIYTEPLRDQDTVRERVIECLTKYDRPMILLIDSLQKMTPVDSDQRINLEKWMVWADSLKLEGQGKLTILITSEINRSGMEKGGIGAGKGTNSIEFTSETLVDLRTNADTGTVQLTVGKHRDGLRGARFNLEKELTDPSNPRSFTFKFRAVDDLSL